jgi:hypothetical protein
MDHNSSENILGKIQSLDLVLLHPDQKENITPLLATTKESISGVLQEFIEAQGFNHGQIALKDGFLFLLNDPVFANWHTLDWWEQRRQILAFKDHQGYKERSHALLNNSRMAQYIAYSDQEVARSSDPQVKQAWMLKRLVLKECYWNVLDSVSCAAYHQKKYQEQLPALCIMLCSVTSENSADFELLLGIDNGIGYVYKKKSRESTLIRLLYKAYKLIFRKGVFYIGGLELGLMETESNLSCHGSGAVVYQGWQ